MSYLFAPVSFPGCEQSPRSTWNCHNFIQFRFFRSIPLCCQQSSVYSCVVRPVLALSTSMAEPAVSHESANRKCGANPRDSRDVTHNVSLHDPATSTKMVGLRHASFSHARVGVWQMSHPRPQGWKIAHFMRLAKGDRGMPGQEHSQKTLG